MTGAHTENTREAKAVLVQGIAKRPMLLERRTCSRFVTVYETGQISGLLGCSDLMCHCGDLEDDSFPDREPVQFLQYRSDVFNYDVCRLPSELVCFELVVVC